MDHERRTSVFLLREARAGDRGAREELFGQLYPQLHEMVRSRMGQRLRRADDSVDVVRSVITDALGNLERFEPRGDGALLRWLRRIAENKLRRRARRTSYGDRDPERGARIGPAEEGGLDPSSPGATPPVEFERDEEREWLRNLVGRLPERQCELVRLRRLEQLDWPAVMERSGETNLRAARGALARGMAQLAARAAPRAQARASAGDAPAGGTEGESDHD